MYSPESIQALIDRVGFADKVETNLQFALTPEVILSNSKRTVKSFHQLAIVENIFSAVSQINMPDVDFNTYLQEIKIESANEVVTLILDQDQQYDTSIDYSTWMIDRPAIFDDAYGYTIAIKVLELFVSTARKNLKERNSKLAIENLKVELEGLKNDAGKVVVQGIKRERYYAIRKAKSIIFPFEIPINGTKQW